MSRTAIDPERSQVPERAGGQLAVDPRWCAPIHLICIKHDAASLAFRVRLVTRHVNAPLVVVTGTKPSGSRERHFSTVDHRHIPLDERHRLAAVRGRAVASPETTSAPEKGRSHVLSLTHSGHYSLRPRAAGKRLT